MKFVNVRNLRINASRVIRKIKQEDIIVTRRGKPVAALIPLNENMMDEFLKLRKSTRSQKNKTNYQIDRQIGAKVLKKKNINVAIVGATGVVGLELLKILAERRFPIKELRLVASERSAGKTVRFKGVRCPIKGLRGNSFQDIDIAFFCAGSSVSKTWGPVAVKHGAIVIDKTAAFRMDKNVPLVVPEVNGEILKNHRGIISSPNCSSIPLAMVLKPLHNYARIKRVIVSTYQSVSGAGLKAIAEMEQETKRILNRLPTKRSEVPTNVGITDYRLRKTKIFPHQISFNAIPQIPQSNAFCEDNYTDEEIKVIKETGKIMGNNSIKISATCVRIPVYHGHSESVNIEFARPVSPAKARQILSKAPGLQVLDNPGKQLYPTAVEAAGKDEVFVGRIRIDRSVKYGLNLWLVGDNIRKGAALNAVQIAELLLK
ncbi:MAG: aspartate-semialdehyde dehydrogenase [Planctomycetota bacterium]